MWSKKSICNALKVRLYNALFLPIAMYATGECCPFKWSMSKIAKYQTCLWATAFCKALLIFKTIISPLWNQQFYHAQAWKTLFVYTETQRLYINNSMESLGFDKISQSRNKSLDYKFVPLTYVPLNIWTTSQPKVMQGLSKGCITDKTTRVRTEGKLQNQYRYLESVI